MEDNIICSGALFYSTSTKRFLFLQRTSEKTKGMWGLVGGQAKYTESAFDGLKREIIEEVGETPAFKKVIPLELFTSNDQKAKWTAERIEAGIIWHNDWFVDGVNLPGGGYKKSGYGRDGGIDSLYSYGQTKRISKRLY